MFNVVFSVIPMYFLSFFPLLRSVEREIDSIRRKFLWNEAYKEGEGFSLVNWKRVSKSKKFGGLGIINPWDFNTALLPTWWWKLFDELGRKWATLVSHSYRPLTGWWSDKCINVTFSSPFWKGVRSVKDIFFLGVAMDVKNGRGTRFWIDKWCSNISLGVFFSELFLIAQDPTRRVLSHRSASE